ncbi:hypothetical protein CDL12_02112 [Handroanthus impetiginosus]|uniref:Uncharacterized protein n=1 Tax=Handroanthus impetiginosus TaxID=429701 RepID=A0A2G9I600_9LAMI|nr:hypothetical protein CDL12_02112 [Handroanthus impetiginosus]
MALLAIAHEYKNDFHVIGSFQKFPIFLDCISLRWSIFNHSEFLDGDFDMFLMPPTHTYGYIWRMGF